MLLNQLSQKEKEAFISLSVHSANANGNFAEEENTMIQEYCKEMDIAVPDAANTMSIDDIYGVFAESDMHIKRIVLLETLGLIFSDGVYDEQEKQFIYEYVDRIGLSRTEADDMIKLIIKYMDVMKEIALAVNL